MREQGQPVTFAACLAGFTRNAGQVAFLGVGTAFLALGIVFLAKSRKGG